MRRSLKRGGSSSSGSRSSNRNHGRTGNCYGDRCDDVGGDTQIAIIIGSIVGGCCLILAIYFVYKHCEEKRRKARKKARKKRGDNAASDSDSDMPKEPIVIIPDDHG